jgi:hypothetical protein
MYKPNHTIFKIYFGFYLNPLKIVKHKDKVKMK